MNLQPLNSNTSQIRNTELPAPVDYFLTSKYANNYVNGTTYKSDLIFYFQPLDSVRDSNFKIKIINFVFPVSFYLVDSNNNILYINTTPYTLTQGNYTATTFATMLSSVTSLTVTFNSSTGTYTFSRTSSSFYFGAKSTCLILLGFPDKIQTSTSTLSSPYTLTSSQPINLSGQYNTIYVDLVNYSAMNMSSVTSKRSTVLASIPVAVNQGALMYYVNQTDSHSIVQDNQISFFHIRIVGEDLATLVNFQGVDWNMNIEVSYVPHIIIPPTINSQDYNQKLQEYLQNLQSLSTQQGKSIK